MRMEAKALQSIQRAQFGVYIRGLLRYGLVVNVTKPDFSSLKTLTLPPGQQPTIHAAPSDAASADKSPLSDEEHKERIAQRFRALPKRVQEVIRSPETEKRLRVFAAEHQLNTDQYAALENEVMLALLDFQSIEDLTNNIKSEVGVSDQTAERLTTNILSMIFEPLYRALEDLERTQSHSAPEEIIPAGQADRTGKQDPGEPSATW